MTKFPPIFLHLFHGRNSPDEELNDWGFDGPTLGPLKYFHVTYGGNMKLAMNLEDFTAQFPSSSDGGSYYCGDWECQLVEFMIDLAGDLFPHEGKYYGDWSIAAFNESTMGK